MMTELERFEARFVAAYRRYLKALVLVMVAGLSSTDPSHAVSRPQA